MLSPVSFPEDMQLSQVIQTRLSNMVGEPSVNISRGRQITIYTGDSGKPFTVSSEAWNDLDAFSNSYTEALRSRNIPTYAVVGLEDRVFIPEDTRGLLDASRVLELQDTHSLKRLESVNIVKRLVGI